MKDILFFEDKSIQMRYQFRDFAIDPGFFFFGMLYSTYKPFLFNNIQATRHVFLATFPI